MKFNSQQLERDLTTGANEALAALLPDSYVLPLYDGRSILNLPATIGEVLGCEMGWSAPPLEQALWAGLKDGVERVIFLLVDGIGWRRLWNVVNRYDTRFIQWLNSRGATVFPITSVSPSTTSVATTTIWGNGAAPAEHGMLGYTFLLAEQSALCNMLFWHPIGGGSYGSLKDWGVEAETFLSTPSIAQLLALGGVSTTSIIPQQITKSPLSKMQMGEAKVRGYLNDADLWIQLRKWLKYSQKERAYCYAYYPDFDTFSHRDGPDNFSWVALWRTFRYHLSNFLQDLNSALSRNTLLLISADHGHVFCPHSKRILLKEHPDLARHLTLMPGGEPRHSFLYARAGHRNAIRDYYKSHLAADFHLLEAADALQAGLYGPPERLHPDTERRIGDFVLLSKKGATLYHEAPKRPLLGMHGSLDAEEMIVPFIAMRLDR
jgi:predicted AlkP superfamily pyrophosphatase or phosphodiesterase